MTFIEAVRRLKPGKQIRRKRWSQYRAVEYYDRFISLSAGTTRKDILATDWIVEDAR